MCSCEFGEIDVSIERWQPCVNGSEHLISSVVKMSGSSRAAKAVVVQSGPQHLEGHKVSFRIVSLCGCFLYYIVFGWGAHQFGALTLLKIL